MLDDLDIPETTKKLIEKALRILKDAGCTEIYIFGSIAEGKYTPSSDIDIAVRNLDKKNYFKIYGKILAELKSEVDLVVLDYKNDFNKILETQGTLKRVA